MEPEVIDYRGVRVRVGDNVVYIQVIYRNEAELRDGVVTGTRPNDNKVKIESRKTGRIISRYGHSIINVE